MAFLGKATPERLNRVLKPIDDLTEYTVTRAIGEGTFDYSAMWRTNKNIIGSFIGVAIRVRVDLNILDKLCLNLFSRVWRKGLERAILSIDDKKRIPLPKSYMGRPPSSADLDIAPH